MNLDLFEIFGFKNLVMQVSTRIQHARKSTQFRNTKQVFTSYNKHS